MDIFEIFLDYFNVFKNVVIKLFDQWDTVEVVATRFVSLMENLSMAILQRLPNNPN